LAVGSAPSVQVCWPGAQGCRTYLAGLQTQAREAGDPLALGLQPGAQVYPQHPQLGRPCARCFLPGTVGGPNALTKIFTIIFILNFFLIITIIIIVIILFFQFFLFLILILLITIMIIIFRIQIIIFIKIIIISNLPSQSFYSNNFFLKNLLTITINIIVIIFFFSAESANPVA
jgi:hypothetical protein